MSHTPSFSFDRSLTPSSDLVGRVKLMMWGAGLLCIGQILLASGVANTNSAAGGYVAAVGLYLFLTIFNGTLLPTAFVS